jgi:hypothetical protein
MKLQDIQQFLDSLKETSLDEGQASFIFSVDKYGGTENDVNGTCTNADTTSCSRSTNTEKCTNSVGHCAGSINLECNNCVTQTVPVNSTCSVNQC